MDPRPIGVFDSGVGGLTVARALIDALPNESIIYFGDTARGPYGPRDREEVRRFTAENCDLLIAEGAKMIVAACNSASASGMDHVRESFPEVPIVEVIEPAVRAAAAATRSGKVGVIGTALTVGSGAYDRALAGVSAELTVVSAACPRFVEFVERGETTGDEIIAVAREYLQPLLDAEVDTIILGCTHYPLLRPALQFVVGRDVVLIESDKEAAIDVFATLTRKDLHRPRGVHPEHRFLASGDGSLFELLGQRFLGPEISKVESRVAGSLGS
jgi:glutamate racemase